jgi:hypothetical protein
VIGGASSSDEERDRPRLLPEMLGFACLASTEHESINLQIFLKAQKNTVQ